MGSNPTLSASLAVIKIPQGRYGVRRKNDIPAVVDRGQPFAVSIHLLRMKQDAQREWFAIRAKPQQEQVARLHYERQGYVVYLPMMRTIVRYARRTEEKLKPFFPGYLFLHLAPVERNWVAISSTRGTLGPICFGDQYVPVPDWIIADLQAKEDGSGAVPLAELQKKGLTPGVAVAVQLDDDTSAQGATAIRRLSYSPFLFKPRFCLTLVENVMYIGATVKQVFTGRAVANAIFHFNEFVPESPVL